MTFLFTYFHSFLPSFPSPPSIPSLLPFFPSPCIPFLSFLLFLHYIPPSIPSFLPSTLSFIPLLPFVPFFLHSIIYSFNHTVLLSHSFIFFLPSIHLSSLSPLSHCPLMSIAHHTTCLIIRELSILHVSSATYTCPSTMHAL